jgi:serine phosphatase RsbU (regulator of sigma subunit)/anti-sigma regulatory factor (Ser/Thr protein kinase)/HAMP domain-containing protein
MRKPTPRTLRQQVFLTVLPLVALLIGSGIAGTALVWHLGHLSGEILRGSYSSVIAMERLNESLENIDSSFQYALAGQPEPASAQYQASWKSYLENLRLEQGSVSVPGEAEAVAKLQELTQRYRAQGDVFYRQVDRERRLRREHYYGLHGLLELFRDLKAVTLRIRDLNQASMEAASLRARATATMSVTGLFVSLLLSLGLAGFLAWNTSKKVVTPIRVLTRSLVGVSEGDLEHGVGVPASEELAELAKAFNLMVDKLRASRAAVEQSTVKLRHLNRAHHALSRCNHALVRASEEQAWMQQICSLIVVEAGYLMCWVGRSEQDGDKSVRPIAAAGHDDGYLENLHVSWGDTERGRGPVGTCIRTGQVVLASDVVSEPSLRPWRTEALRRGYGSIIAIPILVDGRPFGALTIYAAEANAFGEAEVKLLGELADDLAYGIATLRARAERAHFVEELRMLNADLERRVESRTADLRAAREREAAIGTKIQQQLLLDEPPEDVDGLEVAALTVPAQRIAGDFYGFFRHELRDCLDLVVADVMGKGVPAALLSAATKSHFPAALWHLLATCAQAELPEPRDIVTLAHTQLVDQLIDIESFVTLCYVRIDVVKRQLWLVDCGHTGLLLLRGHSGRGEILHGDNLPLGVRQGEIYGQCSVALEPGDLVVLFSDGVSEARNSSEELFGTERLIACVHDHATRPPAEIVQAVRDAVVAFSGPSLADDLTCVVVKMLPYQPASVRRDLAIGSALSELRRAREFVESFCRELPGATWSEDETSRLILAVNEALSNVMRHAYHGRADQRIEITAEAFPDRVAVRLRYQGAAFEPSKIPPPVFDGSREGGFGVFMIRSLTDTVRYYKDDLRRGCIRLEMKFHEAA